MFTAGYMSPTSLHINQQGTTDARQWSLATVEAVRQCGEEVEAHDVRQPCEHVGVDGRTVEDLVDVGAAARHLPCEPCDGLSFFFEFGADEAADV